MLIFPAIDIMNGEAVRLTKGDFDTKEVFSSDPVEVLKGFKESGATCLHVVDLDGARRGDLVNLETIKRLAEDTDIFLEVGGGIRDMQRIDTYLNIGVDRVILGTAAVKNFALVKEAIRVFGNKISVGIDAKDGLVAVEGWEEISSLNAYEFCIKCRDAGVKNVICTDIATDGELMGTNLRMFDTLSKIQGLTVTASGGITRIKEIEMLKDMGVYAAIVGKALYKGALDLKRAIAAAGDKYDN